MKRVDTQTKEAVMTNKSTLKTIGVAITMFTASVALPAVASETCAGRVFERVVEGAWSHSGRFCLGGTQEAFANGGDFMLHSTNGGGVTIRFTATQPYEKWLGSPWVSNIPRPGTGKTLTARFFISRDNSSSGAVLVRKKPGEGKDLIGRF